MKTPRYFMGRDQSGHAYLVPANKRQAWEAWNELDQDDEAAWTPPKWAKEIGVHPCRITFADPKEE